MIAYYVSPLQRCGHICLPVTVQPACVSVSVPFIRSSDFYIAGAQTRDVDTMLVLSWSTVHDANPTLAQYWINGGGGGRVWCRTKCGPPSQTAGQH